MRLERLVLVAAAVAAFSLSCHAPPVQQEPAQQEIAVQFLNSPGTESLALPFSEAVRAGEMLYLTGQLGNVPGTKDLVPGGISEETKQALENVKAIVERHGSSMDRVVKCTVFLADIAEWPAMNEVYTTYFPASPPARSAMGVGGLALGARVEIECIAAIGGGPAS